MLGGLTGRRVLYRREGGRHTETEAGLRDQEGVQLQGRRDGRQGERHDHRQHQRPQHQRLGPAVQVPPVRVLRQQRGRQGWPVGRGAGGVRWRYR